MIYHNVENINVTISSHDIAPEDLISLAVGVITALQLRYPTRIVPYTVLNDYRAARGNSVTIKYAREILREPLQ